MTNISDTIKEQEKEFDEKFVDKIKNINGGLAYEEMKYGEQQDVQELRDWHKSSSKALIEAFIGELNVWLEEKIQDVNDIKLKTKEAELSRVMAVEAFKRVQSKLKEEINNI